MSKGDHREEGDDGTELERKEFDEWLLKRWQEKDDLLKRFNETGSVVERSPSQREDEDEEEEEEEDGRVKGEIAWKPRLRSTVSEMLQFAGIIALVVLIAGWGLPLAWNTVKGATSLSPSVGGKVGCGCGKMGGEMKGRGLDRMEL